MCIVRICKITNLIVPGFNFSTITTAACRFGRKLIHVKHEFVIPWLYSVYSAVHILLNLLLNLVLSLIPNESPLLGIRRWRSQTAYILNPIKLASHWTNWKLAKTTLWLSFWLTGLKLNRHDVCLWKAREFSRAFRNGSTKRKIRDAPLEKRRGWGGAGKIKNSNKAYGIENIRARGKFPQKNIYAEQKKIIAHKTVPKKNYLPPPLLFWSKRPLVKYEVSPICKKKKEKPYNKHIISSVCSVLITRTLRACGTIRMGKTRVRNLGYSPYTRLIRGAPGSVAYITYRYLPRETSLWRFNSR